MNMRQRAGAARPGSGLPRRRARRLAQDAGRAVQGVPDGGSGDQQHADGHQELRTVKPVSSGSGTGIVDGTGTGTGTGVAGGRLLPGGLVRLVGAQRRCPIWITAV
jgi:hypothetical protein